MGSLTDLVMGGTTYSSGYSHCVMCFKHVIRNHQNSQESTSNSKLLQLFIKLLHRMSLSPASAPKKVGLCNDCAIIVGSVTKLVHQIQCLQMQLDWNLDKVREVMVLADTDMVLSKVTEFQEMYKCEEAATKDMQQFRSAVKNRLKQHKAMSQLVPKVVIHNSPKTTLSSQRLSLNTSISLTEEIVVKVETSCEMETDLGETDLLMEAATDPENNPEETAVNVDDISSFGEGCKVEEGEDSNYQINDKRQQTSLLELFQLSSNIKPVESLINIAKLKTGKASVKKLKVVPRVKRLNQTNSKEKSKWSESGWISHVRGKKHYEGKKTPRVGKQAEFACSSCPKSFTRIDNFKRHFREQHSTTTLGGYRFRCARCHQRFLRAEDGLRHCRVCGRAKNDTEGADNSNEWHQPQLEDLGYGAF